ncbi:hypothetical protein HaLaN_23173, partial [Haematococcus lacustris]
LLQQAFTDRLWASGLRGQQPGRVAAGAVWFLDAGSKSRPGLSTQVTLRLLHLTASGASSLSLMELGRGLRALHLLARGLPR